ncbi:hypothetical protein C8J56DRAFT_90440 [Mycena floridula]|nr:hypothetical protein C8J56DRAFT_90440 [Mycena floridula]
MLISDSRVVVTVTCFALLAFTDKSYSSFAPLFYSTSIPLGGLGLELGQIGTIMTGIAIVAGLAQIFVFSKIMRHFEPRRICLGQQCISLDVFLC